MNRIRLRSSEIFPVHDMINALPMQTKSAGSDLVAMPVRFGIHGGAVGGSSVRETLKPVLIYWQGSLKSTESHKRG
jgi:hypothetical protein